MAWLGDLGSALLGALYANAIPTGVLALAGLAAFVVVARRRAWDRAARRHPRRTTGLVAIILGATLPLGWYLGSPLIIRTALQEPLPTPTSAVNPTPGGSGAPVMSESTAGPFAMRAR